MYRKLIHALKELRQYTAWHTMAEVSQEVDRALPIADFRKAANVKALLDRPQLKIWAQEEVAGHLDMIEDKGVQDGILTALEVLDRRINKFPRAERDGIRKNVMERLTTRIGGEDVLAQLASGGPMVMRRAKLAYANRHPELADEVVHKAWNSEAASVIEKLRADALMRRGRRTFFEWARGDSIQDRLR